MMTTFLILSFCLLHYYSSYSCVFMVALSYWQMCLHTYRSSWRYKLTVKWGLWERLLGKTNPSLFAFFSLTSRLSRSRKPFVPGLSHLLLSSSRHACAAALDLWLLSLAASPSALSSAGAQVRDPPGMLWCCKRLIFKILASQQFCQWSRLEKGAERGNLLVFYEEDRREVFGDWWIHPGVFSSRVGRRGQGAHYFSSSSNAAPKYPCYFCSQDFQKKRFILFASNHDKKEKQAFGKNKLNRKTFLQKAESPLKSDIKCGRKTGITNFRTCKCHL